MTLGEQLHVSVNHGSALGLDWTVIALIGFWLTVTLIAIWRSKAA